jgi:hypothetical protein
MYGEGLAGAMYEGDFHSLAHQVGFRDVRELSRKPIQVFDPELIRKVGNVQYVSVTYRLFKLKDLDDRCEDYGQVAVYNGALAGSPNGYQLDNHHFFETNRPVLVCGNTAAMLQDTWLGKYFTVTGNRSVHYGAFDCSPKGGSCPPAAIVSSGCDGGACC